MNIIPNVTCVDNLSTLGIDITADMVCTFKGPTGTESICSGDSGNVDATNSFLQLKGKILLLSIIGGPLMVQSGGQFTLVGLSSFSVTDCAAPFPAVFTRVTYFLEWMAAVLAATDGQ